MLIDWFTVGAQVLNFLILVWLMKRFLYHPILNAIDAREQRIASDLADADAKMVAAKAERDQFQQKNEQFDQRRAELLSKAVADADVERRRLVEQARIATDEAQRKRQAAMARDANTLRQAIGERAQREVFAIARKALGDLASTALEDSMCAVLIRRLRALDGPQREALAGVLGGATTPLVVRSAFGLSDEQRESIRQALTETLALAHPVVFETAPALIGGIELAVDGQKVAWSIADYLTDLERAVDELVSSERKRGGEASSAADVDAGHEAGAAAVAPATSTAPGPESAGP